MMAKPVKTFELHYSMIQFFYNSTYFAKCSLGLEQAPAGKVFISEAWPAETAAAWAVLIGAYAVNHHTIPIGGEIVTMRM